VAAGGVDNGQAAMAKADASFHVKPFAVGAAVRDGGGHARE
jgi:hypothetical protein